MNIGTTPRRAIATLTLIVATTASLSACSGAEDDTDGAGDAASSSADEATAAACRLASISDASVDGPRNNMQQGAFLAADAQTYATAIASLSDAVSAEGEIDPDVTAAIINMVGGFSRSKSYIERSIEVSSYNSNGRKALAAFEVRARDGLVEVCPNLSPDASTE